MSVLQPTNDAEVCLVRERAFPLQDLHDKLYRPVKDIMGSSKSELLNTKLFRLAEIHNISRFDILMYYYYLMQTLDTQDDRVNKIVSFITENNYVKQVHVTGGPVRPEHKRFDSSYLGARWLLAYRLAKEYFSALLRINSNEDK